MVYENELLRQQYAPGLASNKSSYRKKNKYILFSIGLLLLLVYFTIGHTLADAMFVYGYDDSEEISSLVRDSGMNLKGKALFLKSSPEIVNATTLHIYCPLASKNSVEFGCYLPGENKIYILDINDPSLKIGMQSTIAHEMLHIAWEELSYDKKQSLSAELSGFINESTSEHVIELRKDLELYGEDDDLSSEKYSFIGSEIPPSILPQALQEHYSLYFSDSSVSYTANEAFEYGMDSRIAELKNEIRELKKSKTDLDNFSSTYLDTGRYYIQRSIDYGDYNSYQRNKDTYNSNVDIYNAKVDSYNAKREELKTKISSFNALIESFYPDKVITESLTN